MGHSVEFEPFGIRSAAAIVPEPVPESAEGAAVPDTGAIAAYEDGYRNGWDDAVRSAEDERAAIGAELARNLRDAEFSYLEAREDVMSALAPFLSELFERLAGECLPELTAAAIASALEPGDGRRQGQGTARPVVLELAPQDIAAVRALAGARPDMEDVTIREEPALASGQVRLTAAETEFRIDPGDLLARLRAALTVSLDHDGEQADAS